MNKTVIAALVTAVGALPALAGTIVSTYDDLDEDFYGQSFTYNGVTYSDVNNVSGIFPDGSTFEPGDGIDGLGTQIIVENATLLYNDYPDFGSPNNGLTFGRAFVTEEVPEQVLRDLLRDALAPRDPAPRETATAQDAATPDARGREAGT